jgi:hypothetical protein
VIEIAARSSAEKIVDPLLAAALSAYSAAPRKAPEPSPDQPPFVAPEPADVAALAQPLAVAVERSAPIEAAPIRAIEGPAPVQISAPTPSPAPTPTSNSETTRRAEPQFETRSRTDAPVVSNAQPELNPFALPARRPSAVMLGAVGLALVGAFFLGRSTGQGAAEPQASCPPKSESAPLLAAGVPSNQAPPSAASGTAPTAASDTPGASGRANGAVPFAGAQTKAPFDTKAANSALKAAAARAGSCKRPKDPHGSAIVMVTFANNGRAASANVSGAPFSGTPTATCIATVLRGARVPAFAGEAVTVKKTIAL